MGSVADGVGSERLEALSLFYPMYNEVQNVEEAVARALRELPEFADRFEIIIVDDGSDDGTSELADRLAIDHEVVRVVHHPKNRGYGAALQSGIAASLFEWVFYTDGDNQFDIQELSLLLPLRFEAEIVSGYRMTREDPFHRKLNAWTFNQVVRILFGIRVRDADCAFKLYRRSIFEEMPLLSAGALIDVEILARARRRGGRIAEVGVHHFPREWGVQTGASPRVVVRAIRELVQLWFSLRGY